MKTAFKFFLFYFLFSSSLMSADRLFLYEDYYYGMDKSLFDVDAGFFSCTDYSHTDSLCLDNQDFFGVDSFLVFGFLDDKLVRVDFVTEYNEKSFLSLFFYYLTQYSLVEMNDGSVDLDVKKLFFSSRESRKKKLEIFFDRASLNPASYISFYDLDDRNSFKKYKSSKDLLRGLKEDVLQVKMFFVERANVKLLHISYTYPKELFNDVLFEFSKIKKKN